MNCRAREIHILAEPSKCSNFTQDDFHNKAKYFRRNKGPKLIQIAEYLFICVSCEDICLIFFVSHLQCTHQGLPNIGYEQKFTRKKTKSRLASDKGCTIYPQSVLLNSIISFRLKNRFRGNNPRPDQKALQWLVSREFP